MPVPLPEYDDRIIAHCYHHAARALIARHAVDPGDVDGVLADITAKVLAEEYREASRRKIMKTDGGTWTMRQILEIDVALPGKRAGRLRLVWDWTHTVPVTAYPRQREPDYVHPDEAARHEKMGDPRARRKNYLQKKLRLSRRRR